MFLKSDASGRFGKGKAEAGFGCFCCRNGESHPWEKEMVESVKSDTTVKSIFHLTIPSQEKKVFPKMVVDVPVCPVYTVRVFWIGKGLLKEKEACVRKNVKTGYNG
jgi:hypothetical protein